MRRKMQGRLAFSRAIGDLPYKNLPVVDVRFFFRVVVTRYARAAFVLCHVQFIDFFFSYIFWFVVVVVIQDGLLVSTPDIVLTQLDRDVDYLLLASDGLTQKLTLADIDAFLKANSTNSACLYFLSLT